MISALSAAKTLCELRDWSISNLTIHKILYFAHMLSLGRSSGDKPLVSSGFEAWDKGPVSPQVYHVAKVFGSNPVGNVFHTVRSAQQGDDLDVLKEVAEILRDKKPGELIAITHWSDGAWAKNYVPQVRGIKIPDADILDEYRLRVQ